MNNLLQLKLRFIAEKNKQVNNGRNLRSKAEISADKIDLLAKQLKGVRHYFNSVPKVIDGYLVDVHYNDIVAKSNRIQQIFMHRSKTANDAIVGARFSDAPDGEENHIITYYIDEKTLNCALEKLQKAAQFLREKMNGKANSDNFREPQSTIDYTGYKKTEIRDIVIDCSVIDSISVPNAKAYLDRDSFVVTFYKTEKDIDTILCALQLRDADGYLNSGENTLIVRREQLRVLQDKVPYLISMISSDIAQMQPEEIAKAAKISTITIPDPSHEPIIGVIDLLFDTRVYFSKWVDYRLCMENYELGDIKQDDYFHGTAVTSIIVDGPRLNPWLDDNCGRFRVRHFAVAVNRIPVSRLVRRVREIVTQNRDIHVWNLSLGTDDEVSKNFISYDASVLDELQANMNVIFVISATNDNRVDKTNPNFRRIGSPADSLNSMVVGSVRGDGSVASYARKGSVLSFFNKPDVAYYGGDIHDEINAYTSFGQSTVYGTSFAAPWISRKLCYLIDIIGMSKECAKALIIDSAAEWSYKKGTYRKRDLVGYGIVPIDVLQILTTDNSEIRFVVHGTSEKYKTAYYALPIPKDTDGKYPYIARATLCYFPKCTRAQGVDYTNRELSVKFGRVDQEGKIKDINDNVQDENSCRADERHSRKEFRKWDNTKFISKIVKGNRALKSFPDRFWGFSVTSKQRLNSKTDEALNFGAVVTLKEINGINRIEDFIRACNIRGIIVNEISNKVKVEVYNSNQQSVEFE